MQAALGVVGLLSFFAVYFFFPETYHPGKRGVDKLENPSLHPRWRPVLLNPLQPLWLLRSPNLLAVVRNFFLVVGNLGIPVIEYYDDRHWQVLWLYSPIMVRLDRCLFWLSVAQALFDSATHSNCIHNCGFMQVKTFTFKVALTTVFKGVRYNIKNEALIGACFLPSGFGNIGTSFYFSW